MNTSRSDHGIPVSSDRSCLARTTASSGAGRPAETVPGAPAASGPVPGALEVAPARADELEAVLALLAEAALPRGGVLEHRERFLVARAGGRVVGAVGSERYGSAALLRSLVVAPAYRGRGLGRALTGRMLAELRAEGVRSVFLLTRTAAGLFAKFGFVPVAREAVDPAVRASEEFREACCASAVCMRLDA